MRSLVASAAFIAAATLSTAAIAQADAFGGETLPTWDGFYVGAQLNYTSAAFAGSHENNQLKNRTPFVFDFDAKGGAIGGQIGYLHQFDNRIVLGAEIDGVFVDADDDDKLDQPMGPETASAEVDFAAAARLRVGYATGAVLPYVTAGVGLVGYDSQVTENPGNTPGLPLEVNFDEIAFGPVLGLGLEAKLLEDVSLRGDFSHYFVDDSQPTFGKLDDAEPGDFIGIDGFWKLGVGVNYHF